MTLRRHMLKHSLDVPVGALKKVPTEAVPFESGDGVAAATSSALLAATSGEANDVAAVEDAADNVASCGDGGAHSLSISDIAEKEAVVDPQVDKYARANLVAAPKEPAAQVEVGTGSKEEANVSTADAPVVGTSPAEPAKQPSTTKTALELAIDRCIALGDKSDTMVREKWAKRAAPILAESLNFLAEYKAATAAEREAVRARLKAKSGVSRQPNIDNLPLIAVYMCVSSADKSRTKAQRKAWSRFKTVVAVAAAVLVVPDGAAHWLENKTLNSILADWREMQKATGKGARKPSVPKALKGYKHLAGALGEGSEFHELAKAELAKADAAIAEAVSEAAAKAGMVAASSTTEVTTNA